MILRIEVLRSLRWNYRWRGVWAWLSSPYTGSPYSGKPYTGKPYSGNWRRIVREPDRVLMEQEQLASGAFI